MQHLHRRWCFWKMNDGPIPVQSPIYASSPFDERDTPTHSRERTKWCLCPTADWERTRVVLYAFFIAARSHDRLRGACEHTCALALGSREMGIQSSRRGYICVQRRRRGIYLRFICARLDRRRRTQKRSDMLAGYYLPSKQALSQIGKLSLMCRALHFELEACTQEIVARARSQNSALFDIQKAMSLFFYHALSVLEKYARVANRSKVGAADGRIKIEYGKSNKKIKWPVGKLRAILSPQNCLYYPTRERSELVLILFLSCTKEIKENYAKNLNLSQLTTILIFLSDTELLEQVPKSLSSV